MYKYTFILVLFITSCTSIGSKYTFKDYHIGIDRLDITILSDSDITSLPENLKASYVTNKYGKTWPMDAFYLLYPKSRDDINLSEENDEIVCRNGYWFIPGDIDDILSDYNIALIISSKEKLIESDEAIPDQFKEMYVDWPSQYRGMQVKEIMDKGIYQELIGKDK